MIHRRHFLGAAAASVLARPALAQAAPLKIGMITTLSGPGGYLGQDIRDGFLLASAMEDGKLGGAPVRLLDAADRHAVRGGRRKWLHP